MRQTIMIVMVLLLVSCGGKEEDKTRGGFGDATAQAQRAKIDTDIEYLNEQVKVFHKEVGRYPSQLDELLRQFKPAPGVKLPNDFGGEYEFAGPWLKEIPEKPDGSAYKYDPKTGIVSE